MSAQLPTYLTRFHGTICLKRELREQSICANLTTSFLHASSNFTVAQVVWRFITRPWQLEKLAPVISLALDDLSVLGLGHHSNITISLVTYP